MGMAFAQKNQMRAAVACFEKALALDPTLESAKQNLQDAQIDAAPETDTASHS